MNSMDNPEYRKQREKNNARAMELKKEFEQTYGKANTLNETLSFKNLHKLAKYSKEELTEEIIYEIFKDE